MFSAVAAPRFLTQGTSGNGFSIERNRSRAGEAQFESAHHIVGLSLGPQHRAEFAISSDKRKQLRMQPGDLQIVPCGLEHWARWDYSNFVLVFLEPDFVVESGSVDIAPQLQLRNPFIEQLVIALAREAQSGRADPLYAEALATVLAMQLVRNGCAVDARSGSETAAELSITTKHRIAEYIEANLSRSVSLGELAEQAGMGRQRFAQAFKSTFGRPPYQYLVTRRVEHARQLLSDTDLSIADIAYATGFSSQSHLTTTFRRVYGLPPHRYRQRR